MPSIVLRIFLLYNLQNTILLSLIPKKLRNLLPSSWYPHQQITTTTQITKSPNQIPIRPRMDLDELRRVFEMFDRNGDGRITKKELYDSLESMGIFISDAELTQMIEKIDVNQDGCVDIDEFGALYQKRNEEEDMKEAFNVFDQNGDGFITVDELKSVMASLGLSRGGAQRTARV